MRVRAKKHLGQHFLKDENIAKKITDSLSKKNYKIILEVGPGTGVLTKYLKEKSLELSVVEIDRESIAYLKKHFSSLKIIEGDFLKLNLSDLFSESFAVIGNFPYNISSQILFKVLDYKNQIPEVVGMFQKEVAERIAAKPRTKAYGIISILLQAYYDIEYLFTVSENVFSPPPKVKSAVIRLIRNDIESLGCDEKLFVKIVKAGFNQRRKTLRNSLSQFLTAQVLSTLGNSPHLISEKERVFKCLKQRAEELSVNEFVELANIISMHQKKTE